MLIQCGKCGNVWDYKGNRLYATCPNCLSKVKVQEFKLGVKEVSEAKKVAQSLIEEASGSGYEFSISEDKLVELLRKKITEEKK